LSQGIRKLCGTAIIPRLTAIHRPINRVSSGRRKIDTKRTIGSPDPGGTGGVFDLQLDLNPDEVPEEVRKLMEKNGSRNASPTIEPPAKVPEPSTLSR